MVEEKTRDQKLKTLANVKGISKLKMYMLLDRGLGLWVSVKKSNSHWYVGTHHCPSYFYATLMLAFPGFLLFSTIFWDSFFIPGVSGSHEYRIPLLFWGHSDSYLSTQCTARRTCSAQLCMDMWACVPGLSADRFSLPCCTWRRPCLGKSSSSAQLGASGVCKELKCSQGFPGSG